MANPGASSNAGDVIDVDGSMYEGGGGLIRYATSYSSLLNKPIRIHSIRANRPGVQGLRFEHTVAIDMLRQLAAASVQGNTARSPELQFIPHSDPEILGKQTQTRMDISSEGAASILLIALLPYMLFSHIAPQVSQSGPTFADDQAFELVIRAGTLCMKAPSIFYMRHVLLPTLNLIGIGDENLSLSKEHEQGWHTEGVKYPGKIVVRVKPLAQPLPSFILEERGQIRKLRATAHIPPEVRKDFKERLHVELTDVLSTRNTQTSHIEVDADVFESAAPGQYHLLLSVETALPTAFLGYEEVYPQTDRFPSEIEEDSGKIAEYLIRGCIRGIWKELRRGNAVDEHAEDILVMYQTLASGFSSVESGHNERPVQEFNLNSNSLSESGRIYDINASTMHRQTSWSVAKLMTNIQLENCVRNGKELHGCNGIALGHVN
ncbi:RNA 3'-terminal phosphate cyclase/enolpyruvate transferase [Xylaria sp. FL1777]|nr:RNA 3'-terminal phosphate cyclase/enolpyruvate transferase [Xylaria sp. FL1777]